VIGPTIASKVFDGMSLWTAVEPVAIAMCDTAVSDGDAVTFCTATAPWRLSRARPPSRGSTPSSMNFWMKSGLAPSSEISTTRGDLRP
jgi:hypothetical protein